MQIHTYLAGLPAFSMKVLMTEDEDFHAEVLAKMLSSLGFKHIDRAHNGVQAISMSQKTPYHLIISDCKMPEMDGFALISHLRHDPDSLYAEIPLLMLTSGRDEASVQKAKKAGVTHYVAKPFDLRTLHDKII